ncbi:alpha/beta fold hydrolase BchO [Limimaricola sp.]|uniref:alpha/beta fold hydrolase BchO n=1 Tax=Limimaricola sp. TaxID=2211665 RepID=UPI003428D8DD
MAEYSRFVLHRPHRWHVQEAGSGETLLLIHGAGGATQSFRGLFPLLAETHHVVAVDLPGQGFTQLGARQRCGLDAMAEDLLSLARSQGWKPAALVGHSAGAAIALRMVELGAVPRGQVIGINAALGTFKGVAGWLFPTLAKLLAMNPFTANIFAATVTPASVKRLLDGTGSKIGAEGAALYLRLARDRAHVDATLAMMAQWDLSGLLGRLNRIDLPVTLLAASGDTAVPPETSAEAAARLPQARLINLTGLGHLAHEEDPGLIAAQIRDALVAT